MSESENDDILTGWKTNAAAPAPSMVAEDLAAMGVVPTTPKEPRKPGVERTVLAGSRKHVIPPAILAVRMQRYSIYLMLLAFLLLAVNYSALTLSSVLWYASILCAVFAILCAVAVVILNAVAWNFDRLLVALQKDPTR